MEKDRCSSKTCSVFPQFLFVLGALYSLLCCRFLSGNCFVPGFETEAIARSLVATGTFANPYQTLSTGLTAHLPPLYPVFLAALLFVSGGLSYSFFLLLNLTTAIMFGALAAVLPVLARDSLSGVIAALLLVLTPVMKIQLGWEGVPCSLLLVIFCLTSLSSGSRTWLQGLIGAAVVLLSGPGLLFITVWSFGMVMAGRWTTKSLVRSSLICFLFCSPWLMRNYFALGSFCIRDNLGLELQVSNNDLARPLFLDTLLTSDSLYHPNLSRAEASSLKTVGEVEYNRRKLHEAVSWIKRFRGRFLRLSLQRLFFFWFPDRRDSPVALFVWIVTIASIPAMLRSLRTLNMSSIFAASLLAFSLPYVLLQSDLRYRTPVLWVTVLFAGESLAMVIAALKTRLAKTSTRGARVSDMLGV